MSEHYRDCNGNMYSSAHVQGRRQLDLLSDLCNTTLTYHDNVLLVGSVSGYVLLFLFSFGYMCFQYSCIILYLSKIPKGVIVNVWGITWCVL